MEERSDCCPQAVFFAFPPALCAPEDTEATGALDPDMLHRVAQVTPFVTPPAP